MNLVFITSGLAPGQDGVGDYTRDLAVASAEFGHSCALLALNDRRIEQLDDRWQSARGRSLSTLRLPASSSWPQRLRAAQRWIESQSPDWISLQLVAYGFHPKGLIGDLGKRVAPLLAGRRVHLMMHELWIGIERGAPWRQRVIGRFQRDGVLSLIEHISPSGIHTSNETYAALLARRGVRAQVLPLVGSIPVCDEVDSRWLGAQFETLGVPAARASSRDTCWRFALFGSLHPAWLPEPLFGYIGRSAERANRDVIVASIGRQGPGESLWRAMSQRYSGRFSLVALGERDVRDVSMFLQSVDFGIAVTPWQLVGKSASAAAMLDHGLPVIVSRDDVDYGIGSPRYAEPLLYRLDDRLEDYLPHAPHRPPRNRLAEMATQFLADLQAPDRAGLARLGHGRPPST